MENKEINFKAIEKKWQDKWEKSKIFQVKGGKKNKYYVLEMFPYPSAYFLHVGHVRNYAIGDIIARFNRMQGFNVLYPMGYDSFGLPAENAAKKEGINPKEYTENSIKKIMAAQKALGNSYDWSRVISTHEPEYYKWNQYFFLKFLEKGLAYRKKASVNWCEKCATVLANEEVEGGKCWRCETEVKTKELEQWFLKITAYADELLRDIDKLEWSDRIKAMQRNWIGKSHGTEINFDIDGEKWPIFTTRPDTIYGVTFMVISALHPKLLELASKDKKKEVQSFIEKCKKAKTPEEIESLEKEGVFIGKYAINPLTKEKVQVYAGNFVVADYGSGMVMAVPAHDQRDFEFAKKYKIPIKVVIQPENKVNCIIVHGSPAKEKPKEPRENERHWFPWIKKELEKQGIKTFMPLMPTSWNPKYEEWKKEFEKLQVNENSILIGHSAGGGFLVRWLGETGKKIRKLILVAPAIIHSGQWKPLENLLKFDINKKIKDNVKEITIFVSNDDMKGILKSVELFSKALDVIPTELKNHGHYTIEDMKTKEFPELLQTILEMKEAYTQEGTLINSDKFDGIASKEAIGKISDYLESKKLGKKTVNYKLRDWLISRQRYWGTPIPVIYCDKCGIVPVPEKDLPVKLPEDVKFGGTGNPILTSKKFLETRCPKCSGKARRETDTMGGFMDSSWYFLRYCDSENKKEAFDKKKAKYWMPVDQYVGGIEHAVGHLIYSRFFTKALRDLKYLDFDEPFTKLFNQGVVYKDNQRMSKSHGNVVTPEEVSEKYGIDAARLFLMFVAAPESNMEWTESGIEGISKFVRKMFSITKFEKTDEKLEHFRNKFVKEITADLKNFKFNLAIIKLMKWLDILGEKCDKKSYEDFLKIVSVFAPHISEELWEKLGNKNFISLEAWPKYDEKKINEKFEQQEKGSEQLVNDILNIVRIVKERGKEVKKAFVYTLPKEKENYNPGEIGKKINLQVEIFAVNDKKKYDPQGKAGKAKPGKPAIYLE